VTLFDAVESGDLAHLKAALASATDVNALGADQRTPLIEAAARGWLEGVTLLLEHGAEPEWRDGTDETAMLKAAANGHADVARLLSKSASDDDKSLASSLLNAFGAAHAPEYKYDGSSLKRKVAEVAARAANFVGDEEPLARVERVERAEANSTSPRNKKR
jgi:ankyrin repeat protein